MRKIIWSCWFQGRDAAPDLVRKCLQSWQDLNPNWDFRCLDAATIARYIDLGLHIDLARQQITAASLSDILRLLLLHEYGGVWVDATTLCNVPLDDWLEQPGQSGFFAFARPAEDREIATWFLAAAPGNRLLAKWTAKALAYWQGREATRDYFWVHHTFGELIAIDREAFRDWQVVPRISADGPHSVQFAGLYADYDDVFAAVDWAAPLFKLTYRLDPELLTPNTLLARVLESAHLAPATPAGAVQSPLPIMASLRVSTENLGDHIQIIAGERLLARAGLTSSLWVDRDDEIADPPAIADSSGGGDGVGAGAGVGILLNGWFKTNPSQWPPHPGFVPVYLGFHIRLFQSPSLVVPAALAHYKRYGPVGCRDRYTLSLLRAYGVQAFLSHCLTLTFPRRLLDPDNQTEIFVVSRDRRILDYLPDSLGPFTFLSHYSGENDFSTNVAAASRVLEIYRTRAGLIITTLLHCALPAIAMGIPVVIFYPPNSGAERESDKQRFSSLAEIVRVFEPSAANIVDWRGYCPDVGDIKLRLIDSFFAMAARWGALATPHIAGIAATSVLPVPANGEYDYFSDPERLTRLAVAHAPDRLKWSAKSSYRSEWSGRAQLAARHIADGDRVLEIGAGAGSFREMVAHRCSYTGADLQPVDPQFLTVDLETDPLPRGPWDVIVLLGVLEYIFAPRAALSKLFNHTNNILLSYCCAVSDDVVPIRRSRGWISDLNEVELIGLIHDADWTVVEITPVNRTEDFEQNIFLIQLANVRGSGRPEQLPVTPASNAGAITSIVVD